MAYEAHDHFCFIQFGEGSFGLLDSLIKSLPEQCRTPAEAFKRNLRATALMATLPYQMAFGSLWRRNYDFILLEEKLKARVDGRRNTHVRAQEKLLKEMQSEKKKERHVDHILHMLNGDLEKEEIRFAASELIRQCTVQVWSTLEVFASDMFVSLVNAKPSLVIPLMENEKTKRLFQVKGIPFDLLSEYKFDLTSSMGNLLVGFHPIDTIPSMKAVFEVVLPNRKAISGALNDRELWLLFQRRHLIVHRRGIVDSSYLSATGDKVSLGTEIRISPDALEKYMKLVLKAGAAIGAGVAAELKSL